MTLEGLRHEIRDFLKLSLPESAVPFATHNTLAEAGYQQNRIQYASQE